MQTLEATAPVTEGLRKNPLPEKPHWLRASVAGRPIGVDRTKKAVMGYVVAQAGPFMEPDARGEFDEKSLRQIVALMKLNPKGSKSRLGHPTLSDDGIARYTGRARNPRLDSVRVMQGGKEVELQAVRADLYLAESSFDTPNGNLGEYVLKRAEEDSDSFSSSLVLEREEEWRLDSHKQRRKYEDGSDMPPLWRPLAIHASDIVDSGAACTSFLSADILASLPDAIVRQGCELLDQQFAGQDRDVIKARLSAFVDRYLSHRFDTEEEQIATNVSTHLNVGFAESKQQAVENGELLTGSGVGNPPIGTLSEVEAQEPPAPPADDATLLDLYCTVEAG